MKISEFTEHPGVVGILDELRKEKVDQKIFSDVLDSKGKQYVELVEEGGGVLGVALVGYTYALEQMGLRFFSLAGTSAGSINAMVLAGLGDISKPKSEKIIEAIVNKNLYDFVDGNKKVRSFIEALVNKAGKFTLFWRGWKIKGEIMDHLGMNPGNDFLNWLSGILEDNNVKTVADLDKYFGKLPDDIQIRKGIDKTTDGLKPRLALIAADLTTETKAEFPRMTSLYWKDPEKVNPALFVRASMSIPYFFYPLTIENIPQGADAKINWEETVSFHGDVPKTVRMVDGGVMSNFPIDVFHKKNSVPRLPTFGVRLGIDRDKANKITSPLNLFGAMFNSLRHLHDYDFILKNPDYSLLVEKIDIGDHDWLNFGISDEAKLDLFKRGVEAAAIFLRGFDWAKYKQVREAIKSPE